MAGLLEALRSRTQPLPRTSRSRSKPIPGPSSTGASPATAPPASTESPGRTELCRRVVAAARAHPRGRGHAARGGGAGRLAGIDNFNLDLMYALPNQDLAAALADIDSAVAARADTYLPLRADAGARHGLRRPGRRPDCPMASAHSRCSWPASSGWTRPAMRNMKSRPTRADRPLPPQSQLLAFWRLPGAWRGRARQDHHHRARVC